MFPMLGGEVVEGEQCLAIFRQAFDGLLVLDAVSFDERIERSLGGRPGLRRPDILQGRAWPWPAGSLVACSRHSRFCAPSSVALVSSANTSSIARQKPSIGDGEPRVVRQTAPLEIEQQLLPGLRALAAVGKPYPFLLAFGGVVDAIGPDVDVALGRQVAIAPAGVIVDPRLPQPRDGRSRQPAGVLTEQGAERLLEVAGRDGGCLTQNIGRTPCPTAVEQRNGPF
jgi:hypothetical protein